MTKLRGGYTNHGETIGILMLDTKFPHPRGDIGDAILVFLFHCNS